ncbi:uncharacterized protein LOC130688278 [Daphnia carinata]|uniref:uncharacterized protein LOC130688278 n=1 Tax=Daphnia carinata TaxID=120202 RepID=UPI00286907A7|nr:uncharacterized protein LOC130688278 [Daphnia carinata]
MANRENSKATIGQLFAGKNLVCRNELFLGSWVDPKQYHSNLFKGTWKEKEVAVRRNQKTECHSQWEKLVARHEKGTLNHENVLKIIGFAEDTEWRYFALELFYDTLKQRCRYGNDHGLPSDALFLLQMASGINYIHSKGLVHGNLNPNTVLFAYSIPPRVKISEFGLTNSTDFSSATDSVESDVADELSNKNEKDQYKQIYQQYLELSHPKYWKRRNRSGALHEDSIPTATVHDDVFAAGCLFFYLLKKGSHPFGSPKQILTNISESRPINLNKLSSKHFAYQSIKNMIGKPPADGTQLLVIAASELAEILPVNIDENKKLGAGAFGVVFEGTYQRKRVAIKRVFVQGGDHESKVSEIREAEIPKELNHENVLQLLNVDFQTDERYLFLVLELCAGTLEDCVKKGRKGFNLPRDAQVLYQIANGLDYIHASRLVHRDIKPENVLISLTSPAQIKISDFGFCKKVNVRGSFSQSALKGTWSWMAPEMLVILNEAEDNEQDTLPRGTIQSDTYSAGCVFFYFLTNGNHPFGTYPYAIPNVLENNPTALITAENLPKDHFAYILIENMIKRLPERITLPEVMKQLHPLLPAPKREFRPVQKKLSHGEMIDLGHVTIISRFHPIEPVLARGSTRVMIFKAANVFIPFSNWKIEIVLSVQDQYLGEISALEWSSDGTQLAAGRANGVVMVWRYPTGETLVEMNEHSSRITEIAWNPFNYDMLAIIEGDNNLTIWDLTMTCQKPNNGDHKIIRAPLFKDKFTWMVQWVSENHIAFPQNGYVLVVKIYENIEAKIISNRMEKCFINTGRVSIQWNQVKRLLVFYSFFSNLISVWSMDAGRVFVGHPLHTLEVSSGCNCLALRPTREMDSQAQTTTKLQTSIIIACGLLGGNIVICNPSEKSNNRVLDGHSNTIHSLAFSSDGLLLASSDGSKITIWCAKTWKRVFSTKTSLTAYHLSWFTAKLSGGTTALLAYSPAFNIEAIERR